MDGGERQARFTLLCRYGRLAFPFCSLSLRLRPYGATLSTNRGEGSWGEGGSHETLPTRNENLAPDH